MKIVCDACQAKYSISDDKVQGKVFKIRCKKCSNIIVVRGGAGAAEPAPAPAAEKDTRVYDYGYEGGGAPAGDEAVWHVVINQDQVGPMTAADVQQRYASGEIDAETYVWREGFADWLPLAQVDAFAAYVESGTTTTAQTSSGAQAVASMFSTAGLGDDAGTARSDPGDLFAAASASTPRGDDDGGDLFGTPSSVSSTAATVAAPARAAAGASTDAAAAAKLRGERNENSVLFSLNNLAQLASDKPAPVTTAAAASSPVAAGMATGPSGGEGSGLIDIRSMANAYLGGSAAAKPATSSAIGSIDDLPVFSSGGFVEPAVIVPTSRPANSNKLLYALIGSVGLLLVAAIVLVIVMVSRGGGDDKKPSVAANGATDSAEKPPEKTPDKAPDPVPTTPAGGSTTTTPPPTTQTAPPPTTPEPAAKPDKPKTAGGRPTPARPTAGTRPPPTTSTPPVVAAKDPPAPKAEPAAACDDVSCLISGYEGPCCAKFKKGGGAPKPSGGGTPRPAGDLPEKIDRPIIEEGVNRVSGRALACGGKSTAKGEVKVSVKVSPEGGVVGVSVVKTPDPALGNCVVGVMRGASFRKTQRGGTFLYPFSF